MFSQTYTFEKVDYGSQGSKYTVRKTSCRDHILAAAVFGGIFGILLAVSPTPFTEILAITLVLVIAFIIIVLINNSSYSESILILSTIGVTLEASSFLGTSSKYYDIHHIEDIVIVEAITMHSIIFQLVLLSDRDTMSKKRMNLMFKHFRPKLEDLKLIYKDVQTKLVLPFHSGKESR